MEPQLIIKCSPLDYELSELLGEKSIDFIVLLADGVQLEFFGTPVDSPHQRQVYQYIVAELNERRGTQWKKFFGEWKRQFSKQFKLSETTTHKDFHPHFELAISRVCHGHSTYLHCAIRLFEELADQIRTWAVSRLGDGRCMVEIISVDDCVFTESGEVMSIAIGKAVKRLLSRQANVKVMPAAPLR